MNSSGRCGDELVTTLESVVTRGFRFIVLPLGLLALWRSCRRGG
jgi:hypothetical protein